MTTSSSAILGKLLAHLRPDELDPLQRRSRAVGAGFLQRGHDLVADLGAFAALHQRNADQHIARGAKILHLGIGKAVAFQLLADLRQVGRLGVANFDQRTACELDGKMQAAGGEEEHRQQKSDQRDDVEHHCVTHEGDVFANAEKFHVRLPASRFVQCSPSPVCAGVRRSG
jgi:hypothetical protein